MIYNTSLDITLNQIERRAKTKMMESISNKSPFNSIEGFLKVDKEE